MNAELRESTLAAIAVVTAAEGETGWSKPLAGQVASDWVNERPDGPNQLVNGFVQLSVVLLALLKLKSETEPEQALREAAELINGWPDEQE